MMMESSAFSTIWSIKKKRTGVFQGKAECFCDDGRCVAVVLALRFQPPNIEEFVAFGSCGGVVAIINLLTIDHRKVEIIRWSEGQTEKISACSGPVGTKDVRKRCHGKLQFTGQ